MQYAIKLHGGALRSLRVSRVHVFVTCVCVWAALRAHFMIGDMDVQRNIERVVRWKTGTQAQCHQDLLKIKLYEYLKEFLTKY